MFLFQVKSFRDQAALDSELGLIRSEDAQKRDIALSAAISNYKGKKAVSDVGTAFAFSKKHHF